MRNISKEDELIVLASRLTINDETKAKIQQLVREDLDWYYFFNSAIKQKVLTLIYHNLTNLKVEKKVPKQLGRIALFYQLGTIERNKAYFEELKTIRRILGDNQIFAVPTKGGWLIPNVYGDNGTRTIGDIDFLVLKADNKKIKSIMNENGYIQSEYDNNERELKHISKEKEILWRTRKTNLFAFKKQVNNPYVGYFVFDFCFNLDLLNDKDPIPEMISRLDTAQDGLTYLSDIDFFIHLCVHLYKEATDAVCILHSTDLNLIKFCDVREFVLQKMSKVKLDQAIDLTNTYNLQKPVYFTLHYLQEIYNDGYESELLAKINVRGWDFLNEFKFNNFSEPVKWKKTFTDRLFAFSNIDELSKYPEFLKDHQSYEKI
jgi:hypothetical protein